MKMIKKVKLEIVPYEEIMGSFEDYFYAHFRDVLIGGTRTNNKKINDLINSDKTPLIDKAAAHFIKNFLLLAAQITAIDNAGDVDTTDAIAVSAEEVTLDGNDDIKGPLIQILRHLGKTNNIINQHKIGTALTFANPGEPLRILFDTYSSNTLH